MVVADGQVYRVDDKGVVHVAGDALTTPFAAVTFFAPDETVALHASFSCAQLQSYLDTLLPAANVPYAIRVSGNFPQLTVRSEPAQQKPYPPLADALAGQVVFKHHDITGSLIGFRLPDYLAGANVAGYHFHFIGADKQVGGHVLDCTTDAVTVAVDAIDDIQMDLPQQDAFRQATAPASASVQAGAKPLVVFGAYGTAIEEPWNQVVHRALLAAQEAGAIRYSYADKIGYTGDMGGVLRKAIAEVKPDMIFGDASGNETAVRKVAQEHPEIAFVFGSAEAPSAPNLSVFDSWTQEPAYLSGMLAGGLTKSNVVGVVAGFPEASVNRVVNAFSAGAEAVNPHVEVRTAFINSWFDPQAAGDAARAQIEAGADVIFGERTGAIEEAAAHGVYAIGNIMNQHDAAPDYVVSSVVWNMTPTVAYVIKQVRNGSYSAQDLSDFGTMAAGGAELAPINQQVAGGIPSALSAQIQAQRAAIISGRFQVPVDDSEPPASSKAAALGVFYRPAIHLIVCTTVFCGPASSIR